MLCWCELSRGICTQRSPAPKIARYWSLRITRCAHSLILQCFNLSPYEKGKVLHPEWLIIPRVFILCVKWRQQDGERTGFEEVLWVLPGESHDSFSNPVKSWALNCAFNWWWKRVWWENASILVFLLPFALLYQNPASDLLIKHRYKGCAHLLLLCFLALFTVFNLI